MANDPALEKLAQMLKTNQQFAKPMFDTSKLVGPSGNASVPGYTAPAPVIQGNPQYANDQANVDKWSASLPPGGMQAPPETKWFQDQSRAAGQVGQIFPQTPPATVQASAPQMPPGNQAMPPMPSPVNIAGVGAGGNAQMGGPSTPGFWERFNKAIAGQQVPPSYRGVMGELIGNT